MGKAIGFAIGTILLIIVIAVAVIGMGDDTAGNMNNPDIQNAEQQDLENSDTNTESPDQVKQDTGNNADIDQSSTGDGNTIMNPEQN